VSRVEHLLGLSPVFKRLAYYYLRKGVGSHAVEAPYDVFYDEVIVRDLYDWHTPDSAHYPPQGGLVVEFMFQEERVRWAEFGCHYVGGGGQCIMREV